MDDRAAATFRQHRRALWGLAYRMTGSASDADDVVQDAFTRFITAATETTVESPRPWLFRVTVNLARDLLRARRARPYVGPWLPSPVEDADTAGEELPADARYDLRESASYAFVLALEALSPSQRAVLILRDVFDYSVRETSAALGLSEINVKVIHHRARRALASYDAAKRPITPTLGDEMRDAMRRFLLALQAHDVRGAEACLAESAVVLSDGGGEYFAALRPVVGADRVHRFFAGLQQKHGATVRFDERPLNGLPALVLEYASPPEGWAPRWVTRCELDATGAMREIHVICASQKLTHVRPMRAGGPSREF